MEIEFKSGQDNLNLSHAILLYSKEKKCQFASVHDVSFQKGNQMKILPGTAVTKSGLLNMMATLSRKFVASYDILPESVLSFSSEHLMWWVPACKRTVFISNNEFGNVSAIVPHPALVFLVCEKGWFVYALKTDCRPEASTELYHAPYFNVYENGSICTGNTQLPTRYKLENIEQWNNAFFNSAFTHPNAQRIVSYKNGFYALWKDLLNQKFAKFPVRFLLSQNLNLGRIIDRNVRKTEGNNG